MTNETTKLVQCVGCGALVPDIDGPTHRYVGASAGCWQAFGELQARGYGGDGVSDPSMGAMHRLSGETYLAQHPGVPGKQSNQSVSAHLFILCIVLEREVDPTFATRAITQFLDKHKAQGFSWLVPPPHLGPITILDVLNSADQEDHDQRVMHWANSVWQAWKPHYAKIRAWADEWESRQ